jgi:RNA polymerase sigma-70 factor (ECF subfamily)
LKLNALLKRCSKNDRKAQAELYNRYKDTLYFVSLKYCRTEAEAEDNLQDTFLTIFQKIQTYRGEGSLEGWMKRIAIYKAISKYKSKKEVVLPAPEVADNDTTLEPEKAALPMDILLRTIQELPDQYRLVFNLYQIDGFSHREVAKLLDISESTSKSNYHRAKILLRQKITALYATYKLTSYEN